MLCLNEDVKVSPVKFNLSLPKVLMDRFEAAVERYGSRHKGDAIAAAVLLFLQLDSDQQDKRVSDIVTAKLTGNFAGILDRDSPADDNISVLLHPERPEQVLKPKKRKTG